MSWIPLDGIIAATRVAGLMTPGNAHGGTTYIITCTWEDIKWQDAKSQDGARFCATRRRARPVLGSTAWGG